LARISGKKDQLFLAAGFNSFSVFSSVLKMLQDEKTHSLIANEKTGCWNMLDHNTDGGHNSYAVLLSAGALIAW